MFVIPAVLPKGYVGIGYKGPHEMKIVFFFVSWRRTGFYHGGADQANYTPYLSPHCLQTFSCGWIWLKSSGQMPQTDFWSQPPASHCQPGHWSHVMFADEAKVRLYSTGRQYFVWRNNPLALQQHDEIFRCGCYCSLDWPWTHQQISDETSAYGSSVMPVC